MNESRSIPASVPKEIWDVFLRHNLTHDEALSSLVAITQALGRDDEVGAFRRFVHKAMILCPKLKDCILAP